MKNNKVVFYSISIAVGLGIGLNIIPNMIVLIGYFTIILYSAFSYINHKHDRFIAFIILASYLEPYSRTYLALAPYLSLQYFMIFVALYTLLFKGMNTSYKYAGLLYFGLFFFIELLSALRFIDLRYTTQILAQTAAMLSFLYVGSKLSFERKETEFFLDVIFISSLLLSAIISVVYIQGNIEWTDASNFETSGGMGPVQISFYLAIGSFAGLYGSFQAKGMERLIYFFLSVVIIILMILTFSRGGLYMLGLMIAVSFFLQKEKKYIFLVIPLSIMMYWGVGFVSDVTEGKIIDRYTQEGTSSRDLLAGYGWEMFLENPVTGIGTANYYFEVKKSKYLGLMSGAHNEIIRSFAEHGFMGGLLWSLFFIASILQFRRRKGFYRQIAIVLFVVFLASTFHNGLKLALQSLILLIAISSRYNTNRIFRKWNGVPNSLKQSVHQRVSPGN